MDKNWFMSCILEHLAAPSPHKEANDASAMKEGHTGSFWKVKMIQSVTLKLNICT